ncbi:MAG: CDP-glucose 4,6-dehydratase [Pseudomonadota bacterium]
MDRNFWSKKKVLVTGHTGFKGSWLSMWLSEAGADVAGYSLAPNTQPSLFELANVARRIESHIGDIRDLEKIKNVMQEFKPDIVVHMAAQPLVRHSYSDPLETYTTNVIGTANVFEAIRQCESVSVVVNVTTDKCYENKEWCWGYREIEPLGGHDPYSSSKACSELVTTTYQKCFLNEKTGVRLASARAGNVIGGGDWSADRLIPDFMRSMLSGNAVQIRNPRSIRPWQHVLEPLSGYLLLVQKLSASEGEHYVGAWNFGPVSSEAKTVGWIANELCSKWEGAEWLDVSGEPENADMHEANYLQLDCGKANMELNWWPRTNLNVALQWIVDWYQSFSRGEGMESKTLDQIAQFESLA